MDTSNSPEPFVISSNNTSITPIVVGEALIDAFSDGREVIGGAPLNVAWNLQGLGQSPLFVSKVGEDAVGERIVSRIRRWGLSTRAIRTTDEHPTGVVSVKLTDGVPDYEIVYPVAYDFIDPPQDFGSDLPQPALLYLGSLAWRRPESIDRLRHWIEAFGGSRFVDINLRAPWFDDGVIATLAHGASVLKLNDEELTQLSGLPAETSAQIGAAVDRLRQRWGCETFLVTCGSKGAWAITDRKQFFARAPTIDHLVDTVGAGDAFAAAVIDGRLRGRDWQTCLDRGVRIAGRICGIAGATSEDETLYDLENSDGDDQSVRA